MERCTISTAVSLSNGTKLNIRNDGDKRTVDHPLLLSPLSPGGFVPGQYNLAQKWDTNSFATVPFDQDHYYINMVVDSLLSKRVDTAVSTQAAYTAQPAILH